MKANVDVSKLWSQGLKPPQISLPQHICQNLRRLTKFQHIIITRSSEKSGEIPKPVTSRGTLALNLELILHLLPCGSTAQLQNLLQTSIIFHYFTFLWKTPRPPAFLHNKHSSSFLEMLCPIIFSLLVGL